MLGKDLAPYRIGKENTAKLKIAHKYVRNTKNRISWTSFRRLEVQNPHPKVQKYQP